MRAAPEVLHLVLEADQAASAIHGPGHHTTHPMSTKPTPKRPRHRTRAPSPGPLNPLATIPAGPPLERWSQAQRELAQKISNDISEGDDGGETRDLLRMAVAYYADAAAYTHNLLLAAYSDIWRMQALLMNTSLEQLERLSIANRL